MAFQEFKNAIQQTGLVPPDSIPIGKIIAFPGMGKAKHNKAARCFLFDDLRGGWFMDYSTGLFETWQADKSKTFTKEERHAFKQQCERDRLARDRAKLKEQQHIAEKARRDWARYVYADAGNLYLRRKKVNYHGAKTGVWRVWAGGKYGLIQDALICPLFDENLNLMSLQAIFTDKHPILGRDKDFLKGGQKSGCFWWIGKKTATVLIVEGFATGASLHEHTGHQVFIAFDAGNLASVAKIVRAKNPDAEIIICGDNDLNGVGQAAALAAALAVGGKYILPKQVGTDWNDVLTAEVSV